MRTYSELILLPTFEERFDYLKIEGSVGVETFGFDRYLNQVLYRSKEWRDVRDYVIIRDCACDLGIDGREIPVKPLVHHMNPISMEDIYNRNKNIFNPEYLITVSHKTHNAIHYGTKENLQLGIVERRPNDTCPWKE